MQIFTNRQFNYTMSCYCNLDFMLKEVIKKGFNEKKVNLHRGIKCVCFNDNFKQHFYFKKENTVFNLNPFGKKAENLHTNNQNEDKKKHGGKGGTI